MIKVNFYGESRFSEKAVNYMLADAEESNCMQKLKFQMTLTMSFTDTIGLKEILAQAIDKEIDIKQLNFWLD